MEILVIGKFDKESFANHISQTLVSMNHSPVHFPWGVQYSHNKGSLFHYYNKFQLLTERFFWNTKWQENKTEKSIRNILKNRNVEFTIVTHDFLRPAEVDLISQLTSSPIVLWYPDHIGMFDKHMFLNSNYTALFFKEPYMVARLRKDLPDKSIYYLPECCNPIVHKKYEPDQSDIKKYTCDITTAGNLYANRIAFFEQLTDLNLDVRIWGNPKSRWMKTDSIDSFLQGEYVMEREKGMAFQLAKIVLNNLHPCEVSGINCRAFEIPAMGGFQLINYRSGLADLFEPGKEVVSFNNLSELKDQIHFFQLHDRERISIKENGFKRVHAEHTYRQRLTLMFETILKNSHGFKIPEISCA